MYLLIECSKMPSINLESTKRITEEPPQNDQRPVRELTQTDKLNKKLMESFLERLNQTEDFKKFCEPSSSNNIEGENDFS